MVFAPAVAIVGEEISRLCSRSVRPQSPAFNTFFTGDPYCGSTVGCYTSAAPRPRIERMLRLTGRLGLYLSGRLVDTGNLKRTAAR